MLGASCVCVAAGRCLNLRPARWPGRDRWATARRLCPYRREEEATGTAHTTRADAKTRASLTAATTRRDTLTKPRRAPFLGHTRYPAGIHPPGTLVLCSAPNRVQRSVPRARQHVWRARVQHLTDPPCKDGIHSMWQASKPHSMWLAHPHNTSSPPNPPPRPHPDSPTVPMGGKVR